MTRARDLADGADKDITGTLTLDDIVLSNDMSVADNGKVQFGAGNDLQIYHDGSQSYVLDNGTGNLNLRGTSLRLSDASGTHYLVANSGAEVSLTHSGSTKLATTSTGVNVSSTDATVNFVSSRGVGATHTITTGGTNSGIFNITADTGGDIFLNAENKLFRNAAGSTEHMRITSGGNVGIGASSPSTILTLKRDSAGTSQSDYPLLSLDNGNANGFSQLRFADDGAEIASILSNSADQYLVFRAGGATERLRIDSNGTIMTGKTAENTATDGIELNRNNVLVATRNNDAPLLLNRRSSDGDIAVFRKDNTTVGSIGAKASVLQIGTSDTGIDFETANNAIRPVNISTGALRDNAITLGRPDGRFTIVYATTSTINTSDQNEKQQIASLTSAEITAAKAISKLFKTFKWNDAVAAKGDAARTHTGVIAQEVQTAMTDAGLDASKYAFWCSDTWTNDDGSEQTRLGVRYAELLAFVGAATEQRLVDIETRLTALEAAE